jgi:hypothetical protein
VLEWGRTSGMERVLDYIGRRGQGVCLRVLWEVIEGGVEKRREDKCEGEDEEGKD